MIWHQGDWATECLEIATIGLQHWKLLRHPSLLEQPEANPLGGRTHIVILKSPCGVRSLSMEAKPAPRQSPQDGKHSGRQSHIKHTPSVLYAYDAGYPTNLPSFQTISSEMQISLVSLF